MAPSRSTTALRRGLLLLFFLVACGTPNNPTDPEQPTDTTQPVVVPARGGDSTLDVGTWNIEWFGSTANGPSNESQQLANVRDVIRGSDLDIWALQEVVDSAHFNRLKSQLPGYNGFLANEQHVVDGPAHYSDFGNAEQKVGILYKGSLATLLGARVVLTGSDRDFAGRPPMEVRLRVTMNEALEDIVVIVLHMKCCTDEDSYQRRQRASSALKRYLDQMYPTQKVFVIGDWNDDVDTSITPGRASPYSNFVEDAARYRFATQALSVAGISSTASHPALIDHLMTTDEGEAAYVAGSAEVYRVDRYVPNYTTTTSDHYPVLARYTPPRR